MQTVFSVQFSLTRHQEADLDGIPTFQRPPPTEAKYVIALASISIEACRTHVNTLQEILTPADFLVVMISIASLALAPDFRSSSLTD